jgi:hypothetical protein
MSQSESVVQVSPANRDTTPPQVKRPHSKVQGEMRWISSPLWLSTRSTALARWRRWQHLCISRYMSATRSSSCFTSSNLRCSSSCNLRYRCTLAWRLSSRRRVSASSTQSLPLYSWWRIRIPCAVAGAASSGVRRGAAWAGRQYTGAPGAVMPRA